MLIEMLLLCYAARYVYYVDLEREEETATVAVAVVETTDRPKDKTTTERASSTNNQAVTNR